MEKTDSEKLNEIHEFLLGGLDKPGFVSKMNLRLSGLEGRIKLHTKLLAGIGLPMLAVIGEKIVESVMK